jgi:hypothetical protein
VPATTTRVRGRAVEIAWVTGGATKGCPTASPTGWDAPGRVVVIVVMTSVYAPSELDVWLLTQTLHPPPPILTPP